MHYDLIAELTRQFAIEALYPVLGISAVLITAISGEKATRNRQPNGDNSNLLSKCLTSINGDMVVARIVAELQQ